MTINLQTLILKNQLFNRIKPQNPRYQSNRSQRRKSRRER